MLKLIYKYKGAIIMPDINELPIHTLLYRTHQVWNSANREKSVVGLSTGQPKVLRYLLTHPKSLQKDIAKNCDIEAATASLIIDRMEKANLISSEKVKNDRRARWISITSKGEQAYKQWIEYTATLEEKMLANFTEEEKANFKDYLIRSYRNITGHDVE